MRGYLKAFYAVDSNEITQILYLHKPWILRECSWASLTNSPYPGHVLGGAVDIYAPQPYMPAEEGKVVTIKKFPAPKNSTDSEAYDYLILIREDDTIIKILHVKPKCRVGESLYLGDSLGDYLNSGFFYPWTEPHMHVEFRKNDDPIRALGSYPLLVHTDLISFLNIVGCSHSKEFRVIGSYAGYPLAVPQDGGYFCGNVSTIQALIDAGLPHYGYGSLLHGLSNHIEESVRDPSIYINNEKVGEVIEVLNKRLIFRPSSRPSVNGKEITGLGSYLLRRAVKLIGENISLETEDRVEIHWMPSEVMANKFLYRIRSLHPDT